MLKLNKNTMKEDDNIEQRSIIQNPSKINTDITLINSTCNCLGSRKRLLRLGGPQEDEL